MHLAWQQNDEEAANETPTAEGHQNNTTQNSGKTFFALKKCFYGTDDRISAAVRISA